MFTSPVAPEWIGCRSTPSSGATNFGTAPGNVGRDGGLRAIAEAYERRAEEQRRAARYPWLPSPPDDLPIRPF